MPIAQRPSLSERVRWHQTRLQTKRRAEYKPGYVTRQGIAVFAHVRPRSRRCGGKESTERIRVLISLLGERD